MFILLCWIGVLVGIGLFVLGLVAAIAGLFHSRGEPVISGGIVLCASLALAYFGGRGVGWFGSSKESANLEGSVTDENQAESTPLDAWKGKIGEWKNKHKATQEILQRLEKDRRELVAKLREMGVRSSTDLKEKSRATVFVDELHEVVRQIAATRRRLEERDEDLVRMESAVRRLERLQLLSGVGGTEEEAAELARRITDLDDKLNRASGVKDVGQELKAEAILENELKEVSK